MVSLLSTVAITLAWAGSPSGRGSKIELPPERPQLADTAEFRFFESVQQRRALKIAEPPAEARAAVEARLPELDANAFRTREEASRFILGLVKKHPGLRASLVDPAEYKPEMSARLRSIRWETGRVFYFDEFQTVLAAAMRLHPTVRAIVGEYTRVRGAMPETELDIFQLQQEISSPRPMTSRTSFADFGIDFEGSTRRRVSEWELALGKLRGAYRRGLVASGAEKVETKMTHQELVVSYERGGKSYQMQISTAGDVRFYSDETLMMEPGEYFPEGSYLPCGIEMKAVTPLKVPIVLKANESDGRPRVWLRISHDGVTLENAPVFAVQSYYGDYLPANCFASRREELGQDFRDLVGSF